MDRELQKHRKENRRTIRDEEAQEMAEQASVDAVVEESIREKALGKMALSDEIMDDIDRALAETAETTAQAQRFVEGYLQKGGE